MDQKILQDIEDAVVKIYVDTKRFNYAQPWQAPAQTQCSGSGFVLSNQQILTSAHVIANQAHIEVRLANEAMRYEAKVVKVGHDCDLALLTVADEDFWEKAQHLELSSSLKVRDRVNVFGFPIGGEELSITEGIASRIEVQEYAHSRAELLTIQIDAAINPGNSGGPVLAGQKVVGIAHQGIDQGQNIGYIIPESIIRHFLDDGYGNDYRGFPELGCILQPLENKTLRESLGLNKKQMGVRVVKVDRHSAAFDILSEDDVVLEVNGVPVNNDGTVKMEFATRVHLSHLVSISKIGDALKLKVLRNKQTVDLEIRLHYRLGESLLVPLKHFDEIPTYYIFSGLIVQPLTVNYLEDVWGEQYEGAPVHLLNAYQEGRKQAADEQIVILNRVLSTEFNSGYGDLEDLIIWKVNGKEIKHIHDVIAAVEKHAGPSHEVITQDRQKVVVENVLNGAQHKNLMDKYLIEHTRSLDLRICSQGMS